MSSDVDFGDLGLTRAQDTAVREVLSQWDAQRRRLADAQMRVAARSGGERRALRDGDGLCGQVKMQVAPASYHYWGQRLGYECWQDEEFVAEYLRDNPEARVRTHAEKVTVVVREELRGNKRFVRTWVGDSDKATFPLGGSVLTPCKQHKEVRTDPTSLVGGEVKRENVI